MENGIITVLCSGRFTPMTIQEIYNFLNDNRDYIKSVGDRKKEKKEREEQLKAAGIITNRKSNSKKRKKRKK